jgi:pyruvate dehydrogenase E1 component
MEKTSIVEPDIARRVSNIPAFRIQPCPSQAGAPGDETIELLDRIQRRLLWLATLMIHHANHVRPNSDGTKVGGHQASSASVVSIMTALYFHFMKAGDRIAVKPHASPVFHSAMYLLGVLPQRYLTTLREYGGLQSYPSRTKDVDPVDFSTGSVGLGAVAPAFAALTQQYAHAHFGDTTAERYIALSGDAELDEGNVWEAIIEESLQGLNNTIWIIDLNRQSLDRVVPGVRAARLKAIFADCGWQVLEAKYGLALQAAFARDGGDALHQCIDDMSNEEYQSLIRDNGTVIRAVLSQQPRGQEILRAIADTPDDDLPALLANLGGHDLRELLRVLNCAETETTRPSVIFAYTVKGWGLPIAGDPLNHSALLATERLNTVRQVMGIDPATQWDAFPPDSPEGKLCAQSAERLGLVGQAVSLPSSNGQAVSLSYKRPVRPVPVMAADVPRELNSSNMPVASTQEVFGRALLRLAELPKVGERVVTSSPDVSVSTNLAGWINKVGTFSLQAVKDYEEGRNRALHWQVNALGRHIELGISEMNLFMLLGQLGLSHELNGQLLFPIGTVYDPFVCRGLDALIYGLYSGSKFIFAGTPSGVTLAPEGGAHQSAVTASLGAELPNLDFYEPCFAPEVEWALLEGLRQCCDREAGRSTYLRLSTKPIEQSLLKPALDRLGADELQRQALAGGYLIREASQTNPLLHLVTCGTMVPEAIAAAEYLEREGVGVNVIQLFNPRRAFEDWQRHRKDGNHHLAHLIPPGQRRAPILTVHDAAPHALAWLGSVFGQRAMALGVDKFGQSGTRQDVYRYMHIDVDSILSAAFALVEE